jgi:Na+-driven multidrug efflux pump
VIAFYKDPEYFGNMIRIAFPIIIQQLMFSLLNLLGVIFVGQKGDASVAAVGLAGQIAFLLNLVHFGIISGAAMFTAQFWGKRDIPNLRRVLGLCLMLAISASLIFFALSQLFPSQILRIYSKDAAVIELGTSYIRTFSWTFLFFAITFSYALVMRSTGNVKTPTMISVVALHQHVSFILADLWEVWAPRAGYSRRGSRSRDRPLSGMCGTADRYVRDPVACRCIVP